jgi:hypothetical protein
MVVCFSQEEVVLPKATVLGVAEEISHCVVAAINDGDGNRNTPYLVTGKERRLRAANVGDKYENLEDVLGHLTRKERAVLEPA